MKTMVYPERRLEVRAEYDLLVCGAGMAGIAAAVNAAREGLKVGMIEYFGKPGGVPVSGLLGWFPATAAAKSASPRLS